jgi:hypothetical protein
MIALYIGLAMSFGSQGPESRLFKPSLKNGGVVENWMKRGFPEAPF